MNPARVHALAASAYGHHNGELLTVHHPDEVVNRPGMSLEEKRAILAAWASDSHAVEGAPALRQLGSGAVVPVDDILAALRRLDQLSSRGRWTGARPPSTPRRRARRIRPWSLPLRRRRDDDDDPPPGAPAVCVAGVVAASCA